MVHRVLPVLVALMPVIAACGGTSDTEPTDDTVQAEIPTDLRTPIRYLWMPQRATVVSGGSVAVYAGCYARRFSRPTGLNI
jgi:hypothetical protein